MVDATRLLDVVVGGLSKAASAAGAAGAPVRDAVGAKVQEQVARNPAAATAAQAALIGIAGLLVSSRRARGIAGGAKLGSLALLGGLAYKAYQNYRDGKPLVDVTPAAASPPAPTGAAPSPTPGAGASEGDVAQGLAALGVPESSAFHPVSQTEDDALLYLRAMVAAAAADGQIDAAERARIAQAMRQAGIDEQATHWLESELAEPADVEELAAGVNTPEKAAQVYTAARLAIDPDSIQERAFLTNLAQALDVDQRLRDQIDATAAAARG
jgi:uncharacterized membrane protein YebE (DUF533 family)